MSLKYNDVALNSDFPGEIDTPTYVTDLDASTLPKAKHYQELLDLENYEEAESYLNSEENEDLRRCLSSAKLLNELQDRILAAQITINSRDAKQETIMQAEEPAYMDQTVGKFWIKESGEDTHGNKYGNAHIRIGENQDDSEYIGLKVESGTRKNDSNIGAGSCVVGNNCEASGENSFAVGKNIVAKGENQTVVGKFNEEDTTNEYAFIVGGGTSDSDRDNLMSVDWDGNLKINKNYIGKDIVSTKNSVNVSLYDTFKELKETQNLFSVIGRKNLLKITNKDSQTLNGVTLTYSAQYECFYLSGTATSNTIFTIGFIQIPETENTSYNMSIEISGAEQEESENINSKCILNLVNEDSLAIGLYPTFTTYNSDIIYDPHGVNTNRMETIINGKEFDGDFLFSSNYRADIFIRQGANFKNISIRPMIRCGFVSDGRYRPYVPTLKELETDISKINEDILNIKATLENTFFVDSEIYNTGVEWTISTSTSGLKTFTYNIPNNILNNYNVLGIVMYARTVNKNSRPIAYGSWYVYNTTSNNVVSYTLNPKTIIFEIQDTIAQSSELNLMQYFNLGVSYVVNKK